MLNQFTFKRPSPILSPALPKAAHWPPIAGLITYYHYINTLSLPFYQDDFGHIRWLAQFTSPFKPFVTAVGVPAYRPLGEMLLKIWYILLGRHDPIWLRFLNISMHCLKVAIVLTLERP
jgi:hypothetical protein